MDTIAYSKSKNRVLSLDNISRTCLILLVIFIASLITPHISIPLFALQSPEQQFILISEVYYDTPGVDIEEEWIEITNIGDMAIDISAYKIGDEEQWGGREGMVQFPTGTIIEPGQSLIIAQNADGFRSLFGQNPDFEIVDADIGVADMDRYLSWASGDVALANDGDEVLILDGRNRIIDSLNYGVAKTYFQPSISSVITGQSLERIPVNCDRDSAADWQSQRTPTPGKSTVGDCLNQPPIESIEKVFLPLGEIQGSGARSPYENKLVQFRGVVTGRYQDRNQAGITYHTLFVQDNPGAEDGDPQTSDGIAVFFGQEIPHFQPGDSLQISGQVTEFFGLTEIDDHGLDVTKISTGQEMPDPILIAPPALKEDRDNYFEALEGMLVELSDEMKVVGPTHIGCEFAVVPESNSVRKVKQERSDPGPVGLILVSYQSDTYCSDFPGLKSGDMVAGISGPLNFHFDRFKIVHQDSTRFMVKEAPWSLLEKINPLANDQFSVATINLENHFDGQRDTVNAAEPLINTAELDRKQKKLAVLIGNTLNCPTLVAVQEVENEALLNDLAAEISVYCDFTYQVTHRESADARGLDVALLSDPQKVMVNEVRLRQACTDENTGIIDGSIRCSPGLAPLFSRPPLQIDIQIDNQPYQIIINHFKSKLGGEMETAPRRLAQAGHILEIIKTELSPHPDARIIVLGDFNDFERSQTIAQLTDGGFLIEPLSTISLEDRYSYIYDGLPQLIDTILISPALSPLVAQVKIVHLNADYPYQLGSKPLVNGVPYRSSDHDPIIIIFNQTSNEAKNFLVPTPFIPTPAPDLKTHVVDQPKPEGIKIWNPAVLIIIGFMAIVFLLLFRRLIR